MHGAQQCNSGFLLPFACHRMAASGDQGLQQQCLRLSHALGPASTADGPLNDLSPAPPTLPQELALEDCGSVWWLRFALDYWGSLLAIGTARGRVLVFDPNSVQVRTCGQWDWSTLPARMPGLLGWLAPAWLGS